MAVVTQIPELVQQKLAAFGGIQAEFEACFRFQQAVHGQRRFASFSIADIVYYLHTLWICECKDGLLSVYKRGGRYEGRRCLELLRTWQVGQSADVVDFLTRKLDTLSFASITAQLENARLQRRDESLAHRLEHGRLVLLNRGMNLMGILDAIVSLAEERLTSKVHQACEQYGHLPAQIETQLVELEQPLYAYRPHQLLARRNMVVMNRLEVDVLVQPADTPGERSWRVKSPSEPFAPFAEHVIDGYLYMRAPIYNNLRRVRFIDRVEADRKDVPVES